MLDIALFLVLSLNHASFAVFGDAVILNSDPLLHDLLSPILTLILTLFANSFKKSTSTFTHALLDLFWFFIV